MLATNAPRQLGLFEPPANPAYEEYLDAYRAAFAQLARLQGELVQLESERAEWRNGKRPVRIGSPAYEQRTRADAGRLLALVQRLEQVQLDASGGKPGNRRRSKTMDYYDDSEDSCPRCGHTPTCYRDCGRSEEHTSELQSRENLVC